jgi:hypothetical protein
MNDPSTTASAISSIIYSSSESKASHLVPLKARPLYDGKKKRNYGAFKPDPHVNLQTHGFVLLQNQRKETVIFKAAAIFPSQKPRQFPRKLRFAAHVAVRVIPNKSDEINKHAWNSTYSAGIQQFYEWQSVEFNHVSFWNNNFSRSVLSHLVQHHNNLTATWAAELSTFYDAEQFELNDYPELSPKSTAMDPSIESMEKGGESQSDAVRESQSVAVGASIGAINEFSGDAIDTIDDCSDDAIDAFSASESNDSNYLMDVVSGSESNNNSDAMDAVSGSVSNDSSDAMDAVSREPQADSQSTGPDGGGDTESIDYILGQFSEFDEFDAVGGGSSNEDIAGEFDTVGAESSKEDTAGKFDAVGSESSTEDVAGEFDAVGAESSKEDTAGEFDGNQQRRRTQWSRGGNQQSRRRSTKTGSPKSHVKATDLAVEDATVWVNGCRRSSRFRPKLGSGRVTVSGRRVSTRLLSRVSA